MVLCAFGSSKSSPLSIRTTVAPKQLRTASDSVLLVGSEPTVSTLTFMSLRSVNLQKRLLSHGMIIPEGSTLLWLALVPSLARAETHVSSRPFVPCRLWHASKAFGAAATPPANRGTCSAPMEAVSLLTPPGVLARTCVAQSCRIDTIDR